MNDLILMASLLERPKHGYQLKKEAGIIFGGGELHNNMVYPLLRQFQGNGWVRRRTVPGERGQKRLQYALTEKGHQELIRRLSEDFDAKMRDEAFYLRVGLFAILSPEVQEKLLKTREEQLQTEKAQIERIRSQYGELDIYPEEVVGFLERKVEGELGWIKRLRGLETRRGMRRSRLAHCRELS